MPNYGDSGYWDERYRTQKNTTFDWLEGWDDLKELIEKHCIDGLYEAQQITNPSARSNFQGQIPSFQSMEHNKATNIKLVPHPE